MTPFLDLQQETLCTLTLFYHLLSSWLCLFSTITPVWRAQKSCSLCLHFGAPCWDIISAPVALVTVPELKPNVHSDSDRYRIFIGELAILEWVWTEWSLWHQIFYLSSRNLVEWQMRTHQWHIFITVLVHVHSLSSSSFIICPKWAICAAANIKNYMASHKVYKVTSMYHRKQTNSSNVA